MVIFYVLWKLNVHYNEGQKGPSNPGEMWNLCGVTYKYCIEALQN